MRSNKGFTLVELMVTMFVTTTFVLSMFYYYFNVVLPTNRRQVFIEDVQQVLTMLREARGDAIGNQLHEGVLPTGGYGVHIYRQEVGGNPDNVELTVTRFVNDAGLTGAVDNKFNNGALARDTILEQYTTKALYNIAFTNLSPATGVVSQEVTLLFLPGTGEMLMNNNASDDALFYLDLSFIYAQYGEMRRTITMSTIGRFFEITNS